jgi:peptidyl-prolyl cis-trans isomerase B (cyclophilin B)
MGLENKTVTVETTLGNFEVALDREKAPVTVENFLSYVEEGFYDGLVFHRVIGNFMIQGGGLDEDMREKPTKDPIKNEAGNGLKNGKYTIAMARTNVVDSATSQFFINVADNDFLNHKNESPAGFGYAVFGRVTEGTETVDKIKSVETTRKGIHEDVPVAPVVIEKIYVRE